MASEIRRSADRPRLHYDISGPPDGPLLVLGPSLGTTRALWDPHIACLNETFRVLRYDLPGHGASPTEALGDPLPGRTTVADLADLVLTVVDAQGRKTFSYAGVSLGGAIGTQLAVGHPDRVSALALICTSAQFGARVGWLERAALVRSAGMAPVVASSSARWFGDQKTAQSGLGRSLVRSLAAVDPAGYAACCDALAELDLRADLPSVRAPTWVVGGTKDVATPLAHARELVTGLPQATLRIADCAHLALEDPGAIRFVLHTVHRMVSTNGSPST
ncbi:alpha/beta fold hydrolase [Streptomyces scopuliridis]|uniref:alpha/beta fold hydrolase n=1 Tax=Streptomyces scopuliridis TaxID=452529 RepID=UPI0036A9837B